MLVAQHVCIMFIRHDTFICCKNNIKNLVRDYHLLLRYLFSLRSNSKIYCIDIIPNSCIIESFPRIQLIEVHIIVFIYLPLGISCNLTTANHASANLRWSANMYQNRLSLHWNPFLLKEHWGYMMLLLSSPSHFSPVKAQFQTFNQIYCSLKERFKLLTAFLNIMTFMEGFRT